MTVSVTSNATIAQRAKAQEGLNADAPISSSTEALGNMSAEALASISANASRSTIRKHVRALRRALSGDVQASAALQAAQHLLTELDGARAIALYLENDGEISTRPLIEALWQQGVDVYLPVLHPFAEGHLLFIRYDKHSKMRDNLYGIPEPVMACHRLCPAYRLDAIITPLVAFDDSGNRLGMGGGFYDRTLSHLPDSTRVIGLAHDCQRLPALPVEAWDVPLPKIITPSKVFNFS
ncbi:5-formyltetrahydrofolate cyclo-ligase [Shewanella zhangzhouensis]|uniref:5-formyltetrahydrofolate cyclo-ligase n=1 Tax=Shewanella zhangzhouensis TaxID=2864213 RepID=UPI001C65E4F0|nr:5-formyltetrahydrofolate cyclo-ligase [Shewanella zhangzhouensis]QYK04381.1 5-formyltetrahydrofolate cyclo-ligase [Shewanella zhangzhouensis]